MWWCLPSPSKMPVPDGEPGLRMNLMVGANSIGAGSCLQCERDFRSGQRACRQLRELPRAAGTNDHTWRFCTAEACPLSVLETRRLRSGRPSAELPAEAPAKGPSCLFWFFRLQVSPESTLFPCVQSGL